jgi:hypothetical protein
LVEGEAATVTSAGFEPMSSTGARLVSFDELARLARRPKLPKRKMVEEQLRLFEM